jgi:putative tryptophan/tyrosine transport system substrate-binding protein
MKRREFITLLGGAAAAWPIGARAQQAAMPVIGFLHTAMTSDAAAPRVAAFQQGLAEVGFVVGQNAAFEYGWSAGQHEELRGLVADLVRRQVSVIVGNTPPAMIAKSATSTVPIVFVTGSDPVKLGLVASFNRPGGNVTGVSFLTIDLEAKWLGLLHELFPQARQIAALVDPMSADSETQLRNVQEGARTLGREIQILQASTERQIDDGFAALGRQRPDALLVVPTAFFTAQRKRIVELAAHHSLSTIYGAREYAQDGGLISYGASFMDAFRQAGIYTGRILKGANPADLPVIQPTKFELVINLKTAKGLGLEIPDKLLALADEVIE